MSCNWSVKKLGDLVKFTSGGTPSKSDEAYWGGDIPWISASSMDSTRYSESDLKVTTEGSKNGTRLVPKDTVLLLVRGGALHNKIPVGITTREVTFNQDVKALVPKTDEITPWYLLFWLISIKNSLLVKVENTGIGAGKLDTKILQELEVPLPPQSELKRLEKFCKALDDKIILNTDTNQTLEEMAQAIFKSWFVDFDPVKAKMNGEQPKGMDAATVSLFPEKLVESELGLIPDGWELTNIGKVSECFDKKRIPLSKRQREQKQGSIPYYGATSVMDYVDEAIFDDIYLLIGEDGSVMKDDGTPFIQYIWGPAWVNNHAHVLQGIKSVSTEQLMLFFQQTNINAYVTGAVQLKINQRNMNSIPFIKAPKEINERFYDVVAPLYAKIRAIKEENEQLAKLRDTLLPKLLSGEIELGQAQELAEVE